MNAILCVSAFLFFAIFSQDVSAEDGVKKCYVCKGDCKEFKEEICHINGTIKYLCEAGSDTLGDIISYVRRCVPNTEDAKEACNLKHEREGYGYCYTCETDLCNDRDPIDEKSKQGGVKKCYVCEGDCKKPQMKACNLTKTTDYLCQASAVTKPGFTIHKRICVPYTENTELTCELMNKKKDYACYSCKADLCNRKDPLSEKQKRKKEMEKEREKEGKKEMEKGREKEEKKEMEKERENGREKQKSGVSVKPATSDVKKCYYCEEGSCTDPKEILCANYTRDYYLCQATVVEKRGILHQVRKCVPNTKEVIFDCQVTRLQKGVSCYTCNTNLCNNVPKKDLLDLPDTSDEGGVEKCYTCENGQCKNPKEVICDMKDYLCQEKRTKKGGFIARERKCVPNTDEAKKACGRFSSYKKTDCYTCSTNLCNKDFIIKETTDRGNAAGNASAPAMLLATLLSLFLTKL